MDEIDAALAEITVRRDQLATELSRRKTLEEAAVEALRSREQSVTEALAKLDEAALKDNAVLRRMRDEHKVVVSLRKQARKVVQQVIRGALGMATAVGLLLVSVVPELGGWTIFGLLLLSVGATWWLGDHADYLELDR